MISPAAGIGAIGPAVASGERPRKNACVHDEMLADGGVVLYHTCRKVLMTLNPTGAFVWEYCDGAHSVEMIGDELRAVFPDAPELRGDVLSLLRALLDGDMIADDRL